MTDPRVSTRQASAAFAHFFHHGPAWINAERDREAWMVKVRACGFDADALLAEAERMAADSIDATIKTPRPAMTEREARAAVWRRAIFERS